VIGVSGMVVDAKWPDLPKTDKVLSAQTDYIRTLSSSIRSTLSKQKKKAEGKTTLKLTISKDLPVWKTFILKTFKESHDAKGELLDNKSLSTKMKESGLFKNKKMMKNAMSYAAMLQADFRTRGIKALQTEVLFDEAQLVKDSTNILIKGTPFQTVEVAEAGENDRAEPGKPTISYL